MIQTQSIVGPKYRSWLTLEERDVVAFIAARVTTSKADIAAFIEEGVEYVERLLAGIRIVLSRHEVRVLDGDGVICLRGSRPAIHRVMVEAENRERIRLAAERRRRAELKTGSART